MVRELRSFMPHSMAKKIKINKQNKVFRERHKQKKNAKANVVKC